MEKLSDYFETRRVMVQESIRLVREDSEKHTGKVLGLWLMPLMIRGSAIGKDAYFFMRHVDDVADGDLKIEGDPLAYLQKLKNDISESAEDAIYPIEYLASRSLRVLEKRKKAGDDPKKDFLDGIDVAIRDFNRVKNREVLEINDVRKYYADSFSPHFNIMLTAIRSNLRGRDVGIFSNCQGFAYGVQDFDIDWKRGLINIPKEVLSVSGFNAASKFDDVWNSRIVREWIRDESSKNRQDLDLFFGSISLLDDEKAANLLFKSLGRRVKNILETNMELR